jgi:hydroxylamine reductase (hybrid-cluster protein)
MVSMTYHISCDTLSVYAFHKIMEQGDYSLLAKNPYNNFVIDTGRDILEEVWSNIYKQYCELTNDNRALEYYRLKSELIYLETRRQVVGKLFSQIAMRNMNRNVFMQYIKEIRKWGFKYKKECKVLSEMEDLALQIKSTPNRINMCRSKLEGFETASNPMAIDKQVLRVEQALGKNSINLKETSVTKWVYMIQHIKEINEQREKNNKR